MPEGRKLASRKRLVTQPCSIANTKKHASLLCYGLHISLGIRHPPKRFIWDSAGQSIFADEKQINYILGFMCTKIAKSFLKMLNPTLNYQVGNIASMPLIENDRFIKSVETITKESICTSKADWDSFDTFWDFKKHPLI